MKRLFFFLFLQITSFAFSQGAFELQIAINEKYLDCYLTAYGSNNFCTLTYPKKITTTNFIIKGCCKDEFDKLYIELQESSKISRYEFFISNVKMKVAINNVSIDQPFSVDFIHIPLKQEQERYVKVQEANNVSLHKINTLSKDALYDSLYLEITNENKRINVEFVKQNPSSYISFYILEKNLVSRKKLDPDSLLSLYNLLTPNYINEQRIRDLKAKIIELQNIYNQNNLHAKFPSFNFITSTNKQFSFAELSKNKTILLCFWASWCGPCRKEIPILKSIYHKFSSKNFEMISISLDSDTIQWKKALSEEKMNWLQTVDIETFIKDFSFQNYLYHKFIPLCVVIKNGEIIYNTFINKDNEDCKKLIETLNTTVY